MKRLLKTLLLAVAGIVLLVVLSAAALLLFFDPNDFRDEIAAKVEASTGRELVIEGDLDVSLFPWLAVEVGRSRLSNAEGFGASPFLAFESARLSVRLMPLILRREIAVGTAELNSPRVNLAVNAAGVSNWDDLATPDPAETEAASEQGSGPAGLDIASVVMTDATISYTDQASGSSYILSDASLRTGRIALGEAFDVDSEFGFVLQPDNIRGTLAFRARTRIADDFASVELQDLLLGGEVEGITKDRASLRIASERVAADLTGSRIEPATFEIGLLDMSVNADVEAFSWSPDVTASARLVVQAFAPRELAPQFDIELPETADPTALGSLAFSGQLQLDAANVALRQLDMALDDTQLRGEFSMPLSGNEPMRFDFDVDQLNADRYMAPADDAAAAGDGASEDVEIPFELIRGLNARGALRIASATFADMQFTDITLGLTAGDDKLRLNPLSAALFDGTYSGDVRIDASGNTPTLSVDERIEGVSLTPLAGAMFDRDNITGTINGNFVLNARGNRLSAMRESLGGTMSFELADGAWQGVDLWHQLRSARAIYRRETPPEARTPARTEFSSVLASGTVTDGVFTNNDLLAEMPFLQVTGAGIVNLIAGTVDYALQARVLERPEFIRGASEEELAEFTEALIPVRVRGPLTEPSVRPDIEAMFRKEVEDALKKKGDELRNRLLDRLAPPQPEGAPEETPDGETTEELTPEQLLQQRLKNLLGN